ncbi:hypothetical protein [Dactylosporangium sp. CA-092794]|uniref:hypothetical protein n=1 Tax=Dactylosporangium sp. CA-092794 TaxID=3239929 RepID=UPI003D8B7B15
MATPRVCHDPGDFWYTGVHQRSVIMKNRWCRPWVRHDRGDFRSLRAALRGARRVGRVADRRAERAAVSSRLVTVDFAAEVPSESTTEAPFETSGEPSTIYTVYLSAADELVEHIRAADVLNLGFRVESYLVTPDDAPDTTQTEFEFTLFSELPVRVEDRD